LNLRKKNKKKRIFINRDESFQKNRAGNTLVDHSRDEELLEELKVEPVDKKLRRYKSNWLRHVTSMNSNRMPKIMLYYRSNGRRCLGRPLKRLLTEDETFS
jgi:hypothetical protein